MTGSSRSARSRVTRAMDLLRPRSRRRESATTIPWAKPRPRFEIPAVRPASDAVDSGLASYPESAEHLHEGSLGASSAPATRDTDRTAVSEPAAESVHAAAAPSLATRPVYSGFMATVGVGLALLCYYVAVNVGALGGWITGAMFIALGLDPIVRWCESRGLPRGAGVVGVVVLLAGVLALLGTVVIPTLARQAVNFVTSFPSTFAGFLESNVMTSLDDRWGIRGRFDEESSKFFDAVFNDSNFVGGFLNSLVNAGSTIAQTITGTLIVMFLALYFLTALPTIKAWFVRLAPRSKRVRVGELTERITDSVGNYVMGQAVVATLNALFALIVMLILGIPYPLLNAFIVVLLAFVPLVGGVVAGLLVTFIALLQGWQTALLYAICYFAYLQVEAYFISPRIMKRAVAVPAAVAVIAVAAGGALWGVLGAIIAIPVAASGLLLVREVFVPRQDAK